MDIYENVVIGNFLFGLGAAVGARAGFTDSPPISINLLQQTPLDNSAGDVLIQGARTIRLLEFKRTTNDSGKEAGKLRHLKAALSNEFAADLIAVSRNVHWFVETLNRSHKFTVKIRPYLDLEKTELEGPSLNEFISEMVDEAFSPGPTEEETFSRYLTLVSLCQGSATGGSGGLVVSVDTKGTIHYAVVEDLRDLGLELRLYHDLYVSRQRERSMNYQKQLDRSLDGPSRGGMER